MNWSRIFGIGWLIAIQVGAFAQAPALRALRFTPQTVLLVDSAEAMPVHLAIRDLQRDWQKVMGQPLRVVHRAADMGRGPALIVTGGGRATQAYRAADLTGWEAHELAVRKGQFVLQGTDPRGTAYAIYEFCDRFLDVPPLWFWASWQPTKKSELVIPVATRLRFAPPQVRWRGIYPNDEDLHRPWQQGSDERYQALFETVLRLKMNLLDVNDYRDYPKANLGLIRARTARDRGIAVTTGHASPLGSVFSAWDTFWKEVKHQPQPPALRLSNTREVEEFWAYHVELAKREGLLTVPMIGFRGMGDRGFWTAFADAPTNDTLRAALIGQMQGRQVAIVRRIMGDQTPDMRTVLYNENSDYFAKGLLVPPADTSLILNFVAARRDHFPTLDVRGPSFPKNRKTGYYFNYQFTSTGSHLVQGEGPWKMETNYRILDGLSPGKLTLSMVNAGNVREFVQEISANARLLWNVKAYKSDTHLLDFCTRYYGTTHARAVADLYRQLYDAYWQQKKGDIPGFDRQYIFQDERLARAAEMLLSRLKKNDYVANPLDGHPQDNPVVGSVGYFRVTPADLGVANQVEALLKGTGESSQKLTRLAQTCDQMMTQLPPSRQPFFNDNLRIQVHLLQQANLMLHNLTQAYTYQSDKSARQAALQRAVTALRAMQQVQKQAEHGAFTGWYEGEELFGVKKLLSRVTELITE